MVGDGGKLGTGIYNTFTSYHVDVNDFTVKMCTSRLSSPLTFHKKSIPSEAGSSSVPHRSGKQTGTHQRRTTEIVYLN